MIRISARNEFIVLLSAIAALTALVGFATSGPVRFLLAILLVRFLPGYTLLSVLFPSKRMGGFERIGLSVASSMAISFFSGFLFNYTPWGMQPSLAQLAISAFTVIMAFMAWVRKRRLNEKDRYEIAWRVLPESGRGRWLSGLLTFSIVAALVASGYVLAVPVNKEHFTEFYLLPRPGAKAMIEGKTIPVGQSTGAVLGIVNREQAQMSYRIKIIVNGRDDSEVPVGTIQPDQMWEREVSFTLHSVGDGQKVEFQLIKSDGTSQTVFLWLDVVDDAVATTEFYVVFLPSNPWDYLYVGPKYQTKLGIVNREGKATSYVVEMWVSGPFASDKVGAVGPMSLDSGQTWEGNLEYQLVKAGASQWAVFYLFKDDEQSAFRSVVVPIAVRE